MKKNCQPINGFTDFVLTRRTGGDALRNHFLALFRTSAESRNRDFASWRELSDFLNARGAHDDVLAGAQIVWASFERQRKKRRPSIASIRFYPYEHPLLRELSRFDPETGDEATLH